MLNRIGAGTYPIDHATRFGEEGFPE